MIKFVVTVARAFSSFFVAARSANSGGTLMSREAFPLSFFGCERSAHEGASYSRELAEFSGLGRLP